MKFTFKRKEYEHLCSIVGSLMISQFKEQDEYRAVINQIFQTCSRVIFAPHCAPAVALIPCTFSGTCVCGSPEGH